LQGHRPSLTPYFIKYLEAIYISKRKDITSLKLKSRALDQQESAAAAYWVPKVNLFGQYQYYNNRNDDLYDHENFRDAYQVGVTLTWNLFDMSSIAKSKQSVETKYQTEKSLRMAQLRARQDFELWRRKFLYNCSVYRFRVNDVQKATESVRLAKEGRKVGARTNTDLLDAEGELFRARAGLVNAQIGSIEALINLELASGQKIYDFN
jgi:outer membrane protein TolC